MARARCRSGSRDLAHWLQTIVITVVYFDSVASLRGEHSRECRDHHIGAVYRALRSAQNLGRDQSPTPRHLEHAVDLADRDPRTTMRQRSRPTARRRPKPRRQIAARHRERSDQIGGHVLGREPRGQRGQRGCSRDDGAERRVVVKRMGGAEAGTCGHAPPHFTDRASSGAHGSAALHAMSGRTVREPDRVVRGADSVFHALRGSTIPSVRTFVMGDPQAAFDHILGVLDAHAALARGGTRLADDVVLVSIGDHFDYDLMDHATAGANGVRFVRWLAAQDPTRAVLLFGNHDAARVIDLVGLDDARFAAAATLGRSIGATKTRDGAAAAACRTASEFVPQFPDVPTSGLAARDYASYTTEQRALVAELVLTGRFHLALAGELPDGRAALLTHAGVTTRELGLLGLPAERDAVRLAAALEARFTSAAAVVRGDWERGTWRPLDLVPLYVPGAGGEEGGGMLYHRPTNPDRPGADLSWDLRADRPRRFDPRTLPRGLTQVVGHTGHRKCVEELAGWVTPAARAHPVGGVRTLRVTAANAVCYDLGVLPPDVTAADLIMIDGEMRHIAPGSYTLLPLARVL